MAGDASIEDNNYIIGYYDGYDSKNLLHVIEKPTNGYKVYSIYTDTYSIPTKEGYIFVGWSTYENDDPSVLSEDTYLSDLMNTYNGLTSIEVYAVWKVDDSHDKCIFEKGAIDILVDKIKNSKSGPTISASGDILTITN